MFGLFGKEYGKEMDVALDVFYNESRDEFVAGYGHRPTMFSSSGCGETLSEAFADLADDINNRVRTKTESRRACAEATSTSLDLILCFAKSEGEYTVVISDGEEEIVGQGRSTSRAFSDLSAELEGVEVRR